MNDAYISDPLKWQKSCDAQDLPLNMRGSLRFWSTVAGHSLAVIYRNGAPEFSEIVFWLYDNVGLRLWTEPTDNAEAAPYIKFAFVHVGDHVYGSSDNENG